MYYIGMTHTKLTWTETAPETPDHVICISDGTESYYAEMPTDMNREQAIDEFVSTYNFASDEDASNPETREEAEQRLRLVIDVSTIEYRIEAEAGGRIHGTYYPDLDSAKQAVELIYPGGEWTEVPGIPSDKGDYNSHEYCLDVEDCPARIDVKVRR
jgi:hypothetical protein